MHILPKGYLGSAAIPGPGSGRGPGPLGSSAGPVLRAALVRGEADADVPTRALGASVSTKKELAWRFRVTPAPRSIMLL